MANVDSSNLNNLTGWTSVDLGAGTITSASGGGRNFQRFVGTDVWNETGIYRTSPTTGVTGQAIYWDCQDDGNTSVVMGFNDTATITYTGAAACGLNGTNFSMWNGTLDVFRNPTIANPGAGWKNYLAMIEPGGKIHFYYHVDDGTAHSDINDWTYIGITVLSECFDAVGADLYFFINKFTASDNFDVDKWNFTDNGWVLPNLSTATIVNESIDTYDFFTEVETGGTNTITTGGGRTFSRTVGSGAWNVTGIYSNSLGTGNLGDNIYIDYRGGSSNPNSMTSLRQDASILYTTGTAFSAYQDGIARFDVWNDLLQTVAASNTFTSNAWINLRWVIEASGRANLFYHEDTGTDPLLLDEGDWTWIGLSNSNTFRGSSIRVSKDHLEGTANKEGDLDRLYYTKETSTDSGEKFLGYSSATDISVPLGKKTGI